MLVCSCCFVHIIRASLVQQKEMQFGGYLSPLNSLLAGSIMVLLFCSFLLLKSNASLFLSDMNCVFIIH